MIQEFRHSMRSGSAAFRAASARVAQKLPEFRQTWTTTRRRGGQAAVWFRRSGGVPAALPTVWREHVAGGFCRGSIRPRRSRL